MPTITDRIIRLTPSTYVHVCDNNTNITRVIVGPVTFTRMDHEEIVLGPEQLVTVPKGSYALVTNPAMRGDDGQVVRDASGQTKLKHGDREVRFAQEPFPLYPGEALVGKVAPLEVVNPNEALHLRATRDFAQPVDDGAAIERRAGDEWLFEGPGTFYPRVEVEKVKSVKATVLMPNQALRLRARREFKDRYGATRQTGEEWLVKESQLKTEAAGSGGKKGRKKGGAYIAAVEEEIVGIVQAYVLTDKRALHLRARQTFTDVYGVERKAAQEWLVTVDQTDAHIPDVFEELVGQVEVTTLSNRQYCIVQDPVDDQLRPKYGTSEVRTNTSFFLRPGETLVGGVQSVHVLGDQEALLLSANEAFSSSGVKREAGERWMLHGPCDYIPPIEVTIVEKRRAIPLDKNEGIYVRDVKSGAGLHPRAKIGRR